MDRDMLNALVKELNALVKELISQRIDSYGSLNTLVWLMDSNLFDMELVTSFHLFDTAEVDAVEWIISDEKQVELLKAMDEFMYNIDDEEVYDFWATYGVPNETKDDEYADLIDEYADLAEYYRPFLDAVGLVEANGDAHCFTPDQWRFINIIEILYEGELFE